MYTPSLLSDIKRRLTLSEIIGKTVQLRKKGPEHHGLCPFHQEKTPSFTVNNAKEFYHCFGCGAHGSVFDFFMHQHHLTFLEAVQKAAEMAGISLPAIQSSTTPEAEKEKQILLQILEKACQFFEKRLRTPQGQEALQYLIDRRKISPQIIKQFRLGVSPADKDLLKDDLLSQGYTLKHIQTAGLLSQWDDGTWHDKFRNRLMFPILDKKGQVIAFGGRILGAGEPKYLNSPETPVFHKGHTLYNWNHAQNSLQKKDPLVVVEGYMDVISLTQHGYERTVAPLGTALTEDQIQSLWKLDAEPLLCFDGDEAGHRAAKRAAERALPFLKPGKSLSFLSLSGKEDPDSFIQTHGLPAWYDLFPHAQPLVNFLWETESHQYVRKTPEEKALLEKTLHGFCDQIQDPSIKNYYRQEFKNRLFPWTKLPKKRLSASPISSLKKIDTLGIQERILVAGLILHPVLEEKIHEEFALLHFHTPSYEALQKSILDYFCLQLPLEKEDLHAYLIKCGHEKTLQTLLGPDLFLHAPFLTLPSPDLVLEGWHQVRHAHTQKREEQEELKNAKERLHASLSVEEWERYKRLKESFVGNNDEPEV